MIEVCAVAGHGAVLTPLLFSLCFLTENCLDFHLHHVYLSGTEKAFRETGT